MFVQSRDVHYSCKPESSFKVVIPCFGTVSFGLGKDFTTQRTSLQTPSVFSQSAGLPTPSDSYTGSLDDSLQSRPGQSSCIITFDCLYITITGCIMSVVLLGSLHSSTPLVWCGFKLANLYWQIHSYHSTATWRKCLSTLISMDSLRNRWHHWMQMRLQM